VKNEVFILIPRPSLFTMPLISLKEATKLKKKSYRTELGAFLIEGKKIFLEAVASHLEVRQIWLTGSFQSQQREFLDQIQLRQYNFDLISDHHAQLLADTTTTPGFFALIGKPEHDLNLLGQQKMVVVLENIRDPGNVGTMIRTADWFGAGGVICVAGADPWGEKVIRSSMGSVFHLPIWSFDQIGMTLQTLKHANFTIMVTRPEAKSAVSTDPVQKLAVVMGNESTGTSVTADQTADITYSIPQFGQAESLNVGVSLGITLFDLSKQPQFGSVFIRS
jgi:TrmH family RNA methyltransferase